MTRAQLDLVLSKWAAGREKDRAFVGAAVRHGLVHHDTLLDRLGTMPIDPGLRSSLGALIEAAFTRGQPGGAPPRT